ncbi:S8/S53 family peptidase [Phytohabitans rumicis]
MAEYNELVVALPYRSVVTEALGNLGIKLGESRPNDSDERLGLALLTLMGLDDPLRPDPPDAAAPWKDHWVAAYDLVTKDPAVRTPSNVDVLLRALRLGIGKENGGWYPEFGKNRDISDVEGLPYISGGLDPRMPPVPVDPPAKRIPTKVDGRLPGEGVEVALLDTAIFPNTRLAGGYLAGHHDKYDPERPVDMPAPVGHSAFITGLILDRAPGAQVIVRKVLSDEEAKATTWDLATKMAGLVGSGVSILVLACGCYTADGQAPLVLRKAIELLTPGILILAAAGNHGDVKTKEGAIVSPKSPTFPAAQPEVLAVGADNAAGEPASFSPNAPWVGLWAPGVGVESEYLDGDVIVVKDDVTEHVPFKGYARWSGTSFSVATAAGEIAARTRPGQVTPHQAAAQLLSGAATTTAIHP